MTSTAAPQLRRSKRKQNEQADTPILETTVDDAPTTRKRARTAMDQALAPKEHGFGNANEPVMDKIPVRERQHDAILPPFLALPRELRDEIYKHVLEQDGSTTLKTGSRNIVTRCGLVGVNDQISEEFLDAVLFYAPIITTKVRNHNFAPVVTFLNRLSQAQLTRQSAKSESSFRTRQVPKIAVLISTAGWIDSMYQTSGARRLSSSTMVTGRTGTEGTNKGPRRGLLQVKYGMRRRPRLEKLLLGVVELMVDGVGGSITSRRCEASGC
jgi:hypothetical protein